MIQSLFVVLITLPSLRVTFLSKKKLSANIYVYLITSATLVLSMALDNYATRRLQSSTVLLFKSPKLLPVMVGNIVFLKKSFSFMEVAAVSLLVSGFVGFALADFSGRSIFDIQGIAAVIASLTLEAIAANLEEYILQRCGSTQEEAVPIIFSLGFVMTILYSSATGEVKYVAKQVLHKPQILLPLASYAFLGGIGLLIVFLSLKMFGSLQTIEFTSLRKSLSKIIRSFILKDSLFTMTHIVSLLLMGSGFAISYADRINKEKIASDEYPQNSLTNNYEKLGDEANVPIV